ncbi:MAG TPA: glycosyltransferase family 1 protein [Chloroflexota bacterium]|nr:glycosyltransferase family 1 protein [Chloroflexota bacterium]
MTAPRVAIDVTAALQQGGGIGRYTRCLVQALAPTAHSFALTLFWTAPRHAAVPDWLWLLPNVRLRRIPVPDRYATILWQRARLPLAVEVFIGPQEICHFPDFVMPPVWRARTVLTIHDLSFRIVPEAADAGLRRYLNTAVPRSVCRADLVLADSQTTRRDVTALLGVPPAKTAVLYSGVGAEFRPVHDPAILATVRRRYGLPGRFVMTLGTLQPRKNYGRLIQAYADLLRDGGLDWDLVIVGRPGWLYANLAADVARLGLAGRVHFLTDAVDAHLPALYSLADVFILVSLYEGFGLPPLEAMACGTPVIVANVSSLPEVVGDAGVQVDPKHVPAIATALRDLMVDAPRRADLGERGRRQAAPFTWERAAAQLAQHYHDLLPLGPRHRRRVG